MWRSDIFSLTSQRPSQDRLSSEELTLPRRAASYGPEASRIHFLTLPACKDLRLFLHFDRLE